MSVINIIFIVMSICPMLSKGHLTLRASLSSLTAEEAEILPMADAYTNARTYNSTNALDNEESDKPLSDILAPTTRSAEKPPLIVSYELFKQFCNLTGTQLRCDDAQATFLELPDCFLLGTSVHHTFFTKDDQKFSDLTEAVFSGRKSFSCFGGPLLLEGFLSNVQYLKVSNASDEILDIFIQAIKIERQLRYLANLTLTSNAFSKQKELDQILSSLKITGIPIIKLLRHFLLIS